jgi:hypothetical protein
VFAAREATDAVQLRGIEGEIHSLSKRFDATDTRISTMAERRRQDRTVLLLGLAFPLIIALISAFFSAGRI